MLDKDLIPQSHLWTLRMLIGRREIETVLIPPVDTDDIIHRTIPLDPAAISHLKAVEDAVYDNPLLLNQFRAVSAAIDTDSFVILPRDLADDNPETAAKAIKLTEGLDLVPQGNIITVEATDDTSLCFAADPELVGFLRRTFYNISITHPLAPQIAYLAAHSGAEGAVTAALRGNRLDLTAIGGGRLLLANCFTFDALADAAYYTVAARSVLKLTHSARTYLWGDPAARGALSELLTAAMPGCPAPEPLPVPQSLWRSGSAVVASPLPLILQSAL